MDNLPLPGGLFEKPGEGRIPLKVVYPLETGWGAFESTHIPDFPTQEKVPPMKGERRFSLTSPGGFGWNSIRSARAIRVHEANISRGRITHDE